MSLDVELSPTRHCVHIKIARAPLVEGEILEAQMRFKRRLVGRATDACGKIGHAIHGEARRLEPRKMAEVDVAPRQVQMKFIAYGADAAAARKQSIVGPGLEVIELELVVGKTKIAPRGRNRHAISHAIAHFKVAVAVRAGARSRKIHGETEVPGQRPVDARQTSKFRNVPVQKV